MNQIDLGGRKAIVTGGSSGIGLAVARRLLDSGARVALWDRSEQGLDTASSQLSAGERLRCEVVDVTVAADVDRVWVQGVAAFGSIDILVNSAGITGPNEPVWAYPVDQWHNVLQVNLTGTFYCCRRAAQQMRDTGYGRIVNVASVAGKEGNPDASAYSASKAGVMAVTKSLGKELSSGGVLVNCVAPGAVQTPLFDQMSPQHIDYMRSKIPMGRFGTTGEVAAMIAWLASEECSFSAGAVFDLSGGRAVY